MRFVWVWLSEPEMASTGWTGRKGEKNKTKKMGQKKWNDKMDHGIGENRCG